MNTRTYPDGHIGFWFLPENGVYNPKAPTVAELNLAVPLSEAIAWDSLNVNPTDSTDVDDAAITDSATAVDPGFDQYDVVLPLFFPKSLTDTNHPYVVAYNTFKAGRVKGYIVRRYLPGPEGTDTYDDNFASGQWVELFKVISDFKAQDTSGETSTKDTVTFLPQGFMSGPVLVAGTAAVTTSPATLALGEGAYKAVTAKIAGGGDVTMSVQWTSSDTDVATVSPAGVVKGISSGTASITGTLTGAGTVSACSVTVS